MKILLIVLAIAAVVYVLARSVEKALARRRRRNQVSGPVAPDDDLDFLRNLDWEQRKDRQRRRKADGSDGSGETPDAPENDETPGDDTSS